MATLLVAALLLTVQRDYKRMLAYSSMEHMGLIALAAAAGTQLAIAAVLLHILAHGLGKTVLFLAGGQLQAAHDSTAIADITGVVARSRLVGGSFAVGMVVLLGLPAVRVFASELAIARSLADARLGWALGRRAAADRRRVRRPGRATPAGCCSGPRAPTPRPRSPCPPPSRRPCWSVIVASIALGVTAGPLADLFHAAAEPASGTMLMSRRTWSRQHA